MLIFKHLKKKMKKYIYEANRIYLNDASGKLLMEVTFPKRDAKRVDINHVYVDESLRGEGRASELMLAAYQYLKKQKKMIIAKCPYAISWFKKHPEYQDIVINVKTKKADDLS